MTTMDRMQALIDSFPTLRSKGLRWGERHDSSDFIAQCRGLSSGEHHAAAFVLQVWNRYEAPRGLKFDFAKAMAVWDQQHVEAVRSWMRDPWWA